jgi:pimeloyl-ACP methyl ester carboxylesterase
VKRGAVAALLIVLSCAACGGGHEVKSRSVVGEPGRLYEVNGHLLYIQCEGAGEPTVVLEAGYGGDRRSWDQIEPELQRTTRVCSYDRAGLGLSSGEQPEPRTISDQLHDLDDLLQDVGAEPPYVVVGHSYGGLLAWEFARRHKGDVKGLVLVDASHPFQIKRFLAALPPRLRHRARRFEVSPENVRFDAALRAVGDPGSLGKTRLVVLTAGEHEDEELPKAVAVRLSRIWLAMQDDYARRSTDSLHVIARYSPHFIQSNLGQPELVVRAIREVVLAARAGRELKDCRALFHPPAAKCRS